MAAGLGLLPWAVGRLTARSPYVRACGTQLCSGGRPFPLKMASVYAIGGHRATDISLARQGGLNTIRLVDMLDESGPVSGAYDEAAWDQVDADIAAAHAAGLHVELDLSSYRNLLQHNGIDPYTRDWEPFLTFVADRVNTVTGVRYADDPTIALVAFAGEVAAPGDGKPDSAATPIYDFFTRTFAEWHALDPHHLTSTGGMLALNDTGAGIDWQHLMTLPGNDVCAMHAYSQADVTAGMPNLARWCAGRPWVVEEYGAPQSQGDPARAAFFRQVTQAAARLHTAGSGFWNLGPQVAGPSYDVSPAFPRTWLAARSQP